MRILMADGQPAVRSAARLLLKELLDLDVVGEACDYQELLTLAGSLQPDIILIDWDLPGWSRDGLPSAFRRQDHRPRLVVLGANPELMPAALAAGADAFVSKGDPPKRLLTAIRGLSAEGECE